ncbi:MAG: hypothetical protein WC426_05120 [Sulfuriferula sp.]
MLKNRYLFIALGLFLYSIVSSAQSNVGVRLPDASTGINLPTYPELVVVPGYPVYYAPRLNTNYFFYDGMYWIYQDDNWYASIWYNGPWDMVDPELVPVFILRVPVRYYRQPPAYFYGWWPDLAPRWGEHWGSGWERHREGWDRWTYGTAPSPAPLPAYQRQYAKDRYPQRVEQQELQRQNYRYRPHDSIVRQRYQEQLTPRALVPQGQAQERSRDRKD